MGEDGKTGKPSSAFDSLLETSQGVEMQTQWSLILNAKLKIVPAAATCEFKVGNR